MIGPCLRFAAIAYAPNERLLDWLDALPAGLPCAVELRHPAFYDRSATERALNRALHERGGKLDILVGNAGVPGPASPLGHIEVKQWTDTFAVNVTANFQLIRCMEPLLQKSDAGRAVFITSGIASKATAYMGPYAASKAAADLLAQSYAKTYKTPCIITN